ncbi:hypothetical protein QVD17_19309 [Tagetes erecta]|uniref:Uncharacterized protein n=1 Tax=Tagetes erecta TaxID=13708 RepID=A0AAD8KM33_TARER|nr:hypothetical protein QVD17_19309 [Tagetes erecta]
MKIEVENEQDDDGDELDINKETGEFGVILNLVGNIGERPPDLTTVIFTGSSPLPSIPIYKPSLLTRINGGDELNKIWNNKTIQIVICFLLRVSRLFPCSASASLSGTISKPLLSVCICYVP